MSPGKQLDITLFGARSVGKASLVRRYTGQYLPETDKPSRDGRSRDPPLISVFYVLLGDEVLRLHFSKFSYVLPLDHGGCCGFALVFDVTSVDSFEEVTQWYVSVKRNFRQWDDSPKLLCGNKIDLPNRVGFFHCIQTSPQQEVSRAVATEFANLHDLRYFETSAQNGAGIAEMFQVLAEKGLKVCDALTREQERHEQAMRKLKGRQLASDDLHLGLW